MTDADGEGAGRGFRFSPQFEVRMRELIGEHIMTPAVRANINRLAQDVVEQAAANLNDQAEALMTSPAMRGWQERAAEVLRPDIERISESMIRALMPQMEEVNRRLLAALSDPETVRKANLPHATLPTINVVAAGDRDDQSAAATQTPAPPSTESRGAQLDWTPATLLLTFAALYSLVNDVTHNDFEEAARNTAWGLALLLLVLLVNSRRT